MIVDPAEDNKGVGESGMELCCRLVFDKIDFDYRFLRFVAIVRCVEASALKAGVFAGTLYPLTSFSLCVVVVTYVVIWAASSCCGLLGERSGVGGTGAR